MCVHLRGAFDQATLDIGWTFGTGSASSFVSELMVDSLLKIMNNEGWFMSQCL
jgi:hypothetical protein